MWLRCGARARLWAAQRRLHAPVAWKAAVCTAGRVRARWWGGVRGLATVSDNDVVTVGAAVSRATATLEEHGDPEAELAARYLLATAVVKTGVVSQRVVLSVVEDSTVRLSPATQKAFDALLAKRAEHKTPIQYLIGSWDFHALQDVIVRPPVLIPRPETEELVELVVDHVRRRHEGRRPVRVLDVGCGSGVIAIAMLREFEDARGVAIDISKDAVALTVENAQAQGVAERLRVERGDVWSALLHEWRPRGVDGDGTLDAMFDVVVSNPPYIPTAAMADLPPEVADHEDHRALDGGDDGLRVTHDILAACAWSPQQHPAPPSPAMTGKTRALAPEAGSASSATHSFAATCPLLPPGGSIFLELDASHPGRMPAVLRDTPTYSAAGMHVAAAYEDAAGKPRFVHIATGSPSSTK